MSDKTVQPDVARVDAVLRAFGIGHPGPDRRLQVHLELAKLDAIAELTRALEAHTATMRRAVLIASDALPIAERDPDPDLD